LLFGLGSQRRSGRTLALAESCEPTNIPQRLLTVVAQNIEDEVSSWLPLNLEYDDKSEAKNISELSYTFR